MYALAVGYFANCGYLDAMDNEKKKALDKYLLTQTNSSYTETVKCKLAVKVEVDFDGKSVGEIELYDRFNKPIVTTIPFSVEGIKQPTIIMALTDCYKFVDSGNVKVIKDKKNQVVSDDKAPTFNVKVTGEEFEQVFENVNDNINVVLKNEEAKKSYNVVIDPAEKDENVDNGEYATGTIKFSITGE